MHPALQRLLVNSVKFRPILPPTGDGPAGYGPETTPVRCRRSQPTRGRRNARTTDATVAGSVTLYLDGCDFDLAAVPLGSLVNNGGDTWQLLNAAEPFSDPFTGRINHWRLQVGR